MSQSIQNRLHCRFYSFQNLIEEFSIVTVESWQAEQENPEDGDKSECVAEGTDVSDDVHESFELVLSNSNCF